MDNRLFTILRVFIALCVLLLFLIVGSFIGSITSKKIRRFLAQRHGIDPLHDGGDIVGAVSMIGFFVMLIIGIYASMAILGWEYTAILAIVSLSAGLVTQRFVRDFFLGMRLAMTDGFAPGTFIELFVEDQSFFATIVEINWRYVTTELVSGHTLILPYTYLFRNSFFFYDSFVRVSLDIPIGKNVSLEHIDQVFDAAIEKSTHRKYFDPDRTRYMIDKFDQSTISLILLIYANKVAIKDDNLPYFGVMGSIHWEVARYITKQYGTTVIIKKNIIF